MSLLIRDLVADDLPSVTDIYADAVSRGTASYELVPPDLQEMTSRYAALKEKGYPYLAATDEAGALLVYA